MRLIKVSAPRGKAAEVSQVAFSAGIKKTSIYQVESLSADGDAKTSDIVDVHTSTPKGKRFIDALLAADFFNQEEYSIEIRQPRSIISAESLHELTKPLVEPATDILEELWQFSHITVSFVGRVFIAGCLLAFGLIRQQTLVIIAGLLFLPLLPILLGVGFGAWTRQWKLVGQGALAFLTAIVLLILGGVAVAFISEPPLKYDEFNSMLAGWIISVAVGVAAVLANTDDVGRRELIGLAATAQIAIVPVWFGICFVFGFPATTGQNEITSRALGFGLNILTLVVASLATYILLGAASRSVGNVQAKEANRE